MKYDVSLITPTGDRPAPFALCERWIYNQTFSGSIQWIVVDDGHEPTRCTMGQHHVRRKPSAANVHTLADNLREGIKHVQADRVLIIEDDDYYRPSYVATMMKALDKYPVAGQCHNIYYRVGDRRYKVCPNHKHSSLFLTGLRSYKLKELAVACGAGNHFVDLRFWKSATNGHLMGGSPIAVGIKQMPGRAGKTSGWREHPNGYRTDPHMEFLHSLIGDHANYYARFADHSPLIVEN